MAESWACTLYSQFAHEYCKEGPSLVDLERSWFQNVDAMSLAKPKISSAVILLREGEHLSKKHLWMWYYNSCQDLSKHMKWFAFCFSNFVPYFSPIIFHLTQFCPLKTAHLHQDEPLSFSFGEFSKHQRSCSWFQTSPKCH